MLVRTRIAITICLVLLILYMGNWFLYLLNLPSNEAVMAGVVGILLLIVLGPSCLHLVWRKNEKGRRSADNSGGSPN